MGLNPKFVELHAAQRPPWGPLGYIVYKRDYARRKEGGGEEEWYETCARVCNGLVELGGQFTEQELEDLYEILFQLKGCVSGRALWQLGSETVRSVGVDSMHNCWVTTINSIESFCFMFNQLMLGGGVGFNICPDHVYELPVVKSATIQCVESTDCDFLVPDNREGWVELLYRVLKSYLVTGRPLTYYAGCIRPAGRIIKRFGGIASGSESLVQGITQMSNILAKRVGKKLRPIDCLDILNLIAQVVVSGNVRRSAQMALGSHNDKEFLRAKDWSQGSIPTWRSQSNNSTSADYFDQIGDDFWAGYYGSGEPYGLVNLRNCSKFGRLGEAIHDPVVGTNPCGEIPAANREPCNLADIFLPRIVDLHEFKMVARLLYKACKTISCGYFSDPKTREIVKLNHRVGVGITGIMQSGLATPTNLDEVYRNLRDADAIYSRQLGVKPSIKLTTVKPSGTLSLLPGVTPGIHAPFANYLIRRIRFSSSNPLIDVCQAHGYPIEPVKNQDGTQDTNTLVISFPLHMPGPTNLTVIQELELQRMLQTYWSDNAISATHYYTKEEIPTIKEWLARNYDCSVKGCSFLLSAGHGFVQAPMEAITKEQYEDLSSKVKPIVDTLGESGASFKDEYEDNLECGGGACPVK